MFNLIFQVGAALGALVAVVGMAKYSVDRSVGRGSAQSFLWSMLVGTFLAGPYIVIPGLLKIADAGINSIASFFSGQEIPQSSKSRLGDQWNNFVNRTPKSSSSSTPTPSATHSATSTPIATPQPSGSSASESSASWSDIWPWLLGIAVLLVIVAIGIWLIAHANAKRADIVQAAAERREQRKREAKIKAAVEAEWEATKVAHDRLTTRWNEPDHDLSVLLAMPAIRDVSVPSTAAAIEALMRADELRTPYPPTGCENAKSTDYVKAVQVAEKAVNSAFVYAKRGALSSMSRDERKKLNQAQQLLATAQNAAATPSERQIAYERVRALMDELRIDVPPRVMEEIETETRKLLEAAHS